MILLSAFLAFLSPPEEGGLNKERNADNNIIIINYTLRDIMPHQLKNMSEWYKLMCGCECCISAKIMHSSLLTWRYFHMKQLKDRSHNTQNRRSGQIASRIFETYNNNVRPYGCNIQNTAAGMDMENFAPILLHIMRCLTGNVCYVVVINAPVWSYPVRSKIETLQTHAQQ